MCPQTTIKVTGRQGMTTNGWTTPFLSLDACHWGRSPAQTTPTYFFFGEFQMVCTRELPPPELYLIF